MMRQLTIIFCTGFLLNLLWENLHAPLYVHYQGGAITEYVLLRAALFDAIVITIFVALSFLSLPHPRRSWFILIAGALFAVGSESCAL